MTLFPYYVGVVALTVGLLGAAVLFFEHPPLVSISTAFGIFNAAFVAVLVWHTFRANAQNADFH